MSGLSTGKLLRSFGGVTLPRFVTFLEVLHCCPCIWNSSHSFQSPLTALTTIIFLMKLRDPLFIIKESHTTLLLVRKSNLQHEKGNDGIHWSYNVPYYREASSLTEPLESFLKIHYDAVKRQHSMSWDIIIQNMLWGSTQYMMHFSNCHNIWVWK